MKMLLMGDFNADLDNAVLKDFCNLYNVTSLINKASYYKTPNIHPALTFFQEISQNIFRIQVV